MFRKAFVKAALKPLVLAPVFGAAVSISGLSLPDFSFAALEPIGQIANGGALFLTGLVLSAHAIALSWRILAAVLAINVLRPLAVLAFPQVASIPVETTQAALLLCSLPAGFLGVLFAVSYRVPARATATITLGSTLASILTLGLAIAGTLGGGAALQAHAASVQATERLSAARSGRNPGPRVPGGPAIARPQSLAPLPSGPALGRVSEAIVASP